MTASAKEWHVFTLSVGARTKLIAHTVLGNQVAGHGGSFLQVVAGTGGHIAEDFALSYVASKHHGHIVQELLA